MKENWKSIAGFAGLYEVSDMGRVRSFHLGKPRVLKPGVAGAGYLQVLLWKNGKKKQFYVHRLVIIAFRGPIPHGMQVNHINEDKLDNRLENLEVVTAKQNLNHGTRNERAAKANSKKLDLTLAEYPFTKFSFQNSYEASKFFEYKAKESVGIIIYQARKQGRDFINIRKTKYYFSQET